MRVLDPRGTPRNVRYSARLHVPATLRDRLWCGDGIPERDCYAHTLSYQIEAGVYGTIRRQTGVDDVECAAFGVLLWQFGERLVCRRCRCEVLRWHARQHFCSRRCRQLWLLTHPQDVAAGVAVLGALTAARAVGEALPKPRR